MAAVAKDISERSAQRLLQANAALQMAQAQLQLVVDTITDAYELPGCIVAVEGTRVTCEVEDAPDGD